METRKKAGILTVAVTVVALSALSVAVVEAGSTYPVEIAANGGVGGCQSSTGSMSNVTTNTTSLPITIQCPNPNGFAWGRMLDTPDEVADAALVDDGSDVAASFKQTGNNNSRGRKLGLLLRVGDMRVNQTAVEFTDDVASDFTSSFDVLPNGKISKRANLKLRLPKAADLLAGSARCAKAGETAGVTWTADLSARGNAYRAYTPSVLVDCGAGSNGTTLVSNSNSMVPAADSSKLMSVTALCPSAGQTAIAGGYDIAGSTTSQWPQIVTNGPDASGAGWKATVAVPSQNSTAAKAVLKVWVTCKG